ncbi:hypothetical protein BC351_06215 [Paenibacillus ferrarius]|uniref:Uncharacterized protein n=1 Tax=Paenibacillus ferrarius TaxID=1469647 RepID=A0A1V4HFC7_9BACL|nr:hypothetical protein [Paenibacillus ferrarius]OPH53455.1 hypothetical protein BC351_06215 [Paenibacillus ferrarius]
MNRLGCIITLSVLAIGLMTGCTSPDRDLTVKQPSLASPSPTATTKPNAITTPSVSSKDTIIQQFQLAAGKAKEAREVIPFVDTNIGQLDAATADLLFHELEQFYDQHIPSLNANFKQMLSQPGTSEKLNDLGYPMDFNNIKKDETLKQWLLHQKEGKLALDSQQGDFYWRVDYEALRKTYSKLLSVETQDYLSLRATEDNQRFSSDGSLKITRTELGERIIAAESYLTKYTKGVHKPVVTTLYQDYMKEYVQNYRYDAIDETTMKLLPEVKKSYEQFVKQHAATKSGKLVQDYLTLINQNKDVIYNPGKKGESLIGNPKDNISAFWESLNSRISQQFQ